MMMIMMMMMMMLMKLCHEQLATRRIRNSIAVNHPWIVQHED